MKNTNNKDLVYVAMRGDLINSGHINILTKASSLEEWLLDFCLTRPLKVTKKDHF